MFPSQERLVKWGTMMLMYVFCRSQMEFLILSSSSVLSFEFDMCMVDIRMCKWNELMHLFVGWKARSLRIAFEKFPWLLQYTIFGSKEMIMSIITKYIQFFFIFSFINFYAWKIYRVPFHFIQFYFMIYVFCLFFYKL